MLGPLGILRLCEYIVLVGDNLFEIFDGFTFTMDERDSLFSEVVVSEHIVITAWHKLHFVSDFSALLSVFQFARRSGWVSKRLASKQLLSLIDFLQQISQGYTGIIT